MLEAATLTSTFLAFALLHGAAPSRRPSHLGARVLGCGPAVPRAFAGLLLAASVAQWTRVDGACAAFLVVVAAFCLAATLFVLLVSVLPRLAWALAVACAPAVIVLSVLGGRHG